jgi:signal transduction histidine kinase
MTPLAWIGLVNFLSSAGLAVFVLLKRFQSPVARTYAALNFTISGFSFFYFLWQVDSDPARVMTEFSWLVLFLIWMNQAYIHFVHRFLGRPKWARVVELVAAAGNVVFTVMLLQGRLYTGLVPKFGLGLWPHVLPAFFAYLIFWHLAYLYGVGRILSLYPSMSPLMQQQSRLLITAFLIGYGGGSTNWLVWLDIHFPPYPTIFITVYVAIVAYCITRHRLMDIRPAIRKTILYSVVTSALIAIYVSTVSLAAGFFRTNSDSRFPPSSIAAAIAITLLFEPLRRRVQRSLDRIFQRERQDVDQTLYRFTSANNQSTSIQSTADALANAIREIFRPTAAAIYHRTHEDVFRRASFFGTIPFEEICRDVPTSTGQGDGSAGVLPITTSARVNGFAWLGPRTSEEPYSENDLKLIGILLHQTAAALERPELVRDLSGAYAHEIKSPLSSLTLPAEYALLELERAEKENRPWSEVIPPLKQRLRRILDQAFLVSRRVDALRELSALGTPVRQRVDLVDVVRKTAEEARHEVGSKSAEVRISAAIEPAFMVGDRSQLEIVFVNLLRNALESRSAGAVVEIVIRRDGSTWLTTVRDNGGGVGPADRARIFDAHFSTKCGEGRGMGLYLVRQILRAHGGDVTLEPSSAGAEFRVRLPVEE